MFNNVVCVDFVHTLAGYEDSTANCCNLDTAVELQCRSTADLCSASSQSLQCAVYASKTRTEKFSGRGENCQRNVTDLARSLVTSCRPPGRLQNTPDDRTWNAGVAVRTADGSRRTADAGDEQCPRCGCSSPSCTVMFARLGRVSRPIKHQVTYSLLT